MAGSVDVGGPLPSDRAYREHPTAVYRYRAGAQGGLLGGMAMTVVAFVYGLVTGVGVWVPVNLIGATLVRELQGASFEQLQQFDYAAVVAGLLIHITMSVGLGLVFALLLPALPGRPLIWGAVLGPLLFTITSLAVLPIVNDVMARYLDWVSFAVAHVAYGLVLGAWIEHSRRVPAWHAPDAVGRPVEPDAP
jgi:hypothetical protein